jgi:hypothetical protein
MGLFSVCPLSRNAGTVTKFHGDRHGHQISQDLIIIAQFRLMAGPSMIVRELPSFAIHRPRLSRANPAI